MARYDTADGRILTWALEAHVVDHCNLRCAHCCPLSPHLPPRTTAPDALASDLQRAARVLRPALFKLTGGEPLLHPALADCARAARASGIAPEISLTTNGLLLPGAPDDLFGTLDRITVSRYPAPRLGDAALARIAARCREHGVMLTVKDAPRFQVLDAPAPQGEEETRRVHAACWLKVRCHLVHEGRLFACTRPPHLEAVGAAPGLCAADGVDLEGPVARVRSRVLALLEQEVPYRSCVRCRGSSGPWEAHRQLRVAERAPAFHPAGREASAGSG